MRSRTVRIRVEIRVIRKINAEFYASLSIAQRCVCLTVTVLLVCILNINYFKAILWGVARNRAASAKIILSRSPFFPPQPPFDWNSIQPPIPFHISSSEIDTGRNSSESSILSMARIRKNKPYGHRSVVSVVVEKKNT